MIKEGREAGKEISNKKCKIVYSDGLDGRTRVIRGLRRPDDGDFLVVLRADGALFRVARKSINLIIEEVASAEEVL